MFVRVQINAKLQPVDRAGMEDDVITPFLEKHGLGHVCGGGTLLGGKGKEIESCDVEIEMPEPAPEAMQKLVAFLDDVVPRGSRFVHGAKTALTTVPIGRLSGLGVYLNGTDLPDEVYQTSDINFVVEELEKRLASSLHYRAHWQGPTETALYFYCAASFDAMKAAIADFVASYPLCQRARIVEIA